MDSKFNILYYSKNCQHCQKILDFIVKNGFMQELNCICVDKRTKNEMSQWVVQLENGKIHPLPPNIGRVPALFLIKDKRQALFGDSIIEHLKPSAMAKQEVAFAGNGEPVGFKLDSAFSQSYEPY